MSSVCSTVCPFPRIPDRIEAEVAVDLSWVAPGPVFRAAPPDPKETQ